jgi:hypothetical protein
LALGTKVLFLTVVILVVSTLTVAITVPEQAEAAKDKYCILGYGPDIQTFYQCFQKKKQCEEGLQIAQQDHPDFVFSEPSCFKKF